MHIADIIKFESVVPKAFEIAARHPAEPESRRAPPAVIFSAPEVFRPEKLIPLIEVCAAAGKFVAPPPPKPNHLQ